ncbi:AAA family ATPase [Paenibacillus filicis]|uniref:AAA family ATPase n=1 Tax=Paenibacillus gyeongsangnamensis TaxID=3388067 RepID=A0ABT4QIA0_9BACL|nr:ATP-binding protein [Paenibacillus filicis]MCZ8516594.1 AAA family ATPase [Paenibacillus filicis]
MFFLQMSGYPGSGKSTLARAISKNTGAVVIDHDIVKSALLESSESVIDPKVAGKISYTIDWALADFHLSQGHSVIFDSPCMYTEMLEKGTRLSEKYHAKYKYVECFLNDLYEVDRRLKTRERMRSQVSEVPSEVLHTFKLSIDNSKSKRPSAPYLIVDTAQSLDRYFDEVMAYMNE